MTPLEEKIRLLVDSYGLETLVENLDIEPEIVILALIDQGVLSERDLEDL